MNDASSVTMGSEQLTTADLVPYATDGQFVMRFGESGVLYGDLIGAAVADDCLVLNFLWMAQRGNIRLINADPDAEEVRIPLRGYQIERLPDVPELWLRHKTHEHDNMRFLKGAHPDALDQPGGK